MSLDDARDKLAQVVRQRQVKFVFAESCTAGLCAATMGQVNGISDYLCGSAVTYRADTKQQWLSVSDASIAAHTCESPQVVREMAKGVLERTPEADWAAAVVGHLADDRPSFIYIATATSLTDASATATGAIEVEGETRPIRQAHAAELVLDHLRRAIDDL